MSPHNHPTPCVGTAAVSARDDPMRLSTDLVAAASLLVDACRVEHYDRPTLYLPPPVSGISTLLGCAVVEGTARPGWVVAKAPGGGISTAPIGTDNLERVLRGPEVGMTFYVGGPLHGQVHQRREAEQFVSLPVYLRLDLDDVQLSSVPYVTGHYRRCDATSDGWWPYLWQGVTA